jgi:hypothetical protein
MQRALELLPVELLRDVDTGEPLVCCIRLGEVVAEVSLGGNRGRRSEGDASLWAGSVLLDLSAYDRGSHTGNAGDLAIDIGTAEFAQLVGSTTLPLSDAASKETHRRWVAPQNPSDGRDTPRNLLHLKVRASEPASLRNRTDLDWVVRWAGPNPYWPGRGQVCVLRQRSSGQVSRTGNGSGPGVVSDPLSNQTR